MGHKRTPAECTIVGCVKQQVGRGWCSTHWARWKRNGDPNLLQPVKSMADRFADKHVADPGAA